MYRLLVHSRDYHGKLCRMPSWNQWSCGKGCDGALGVLQLWLQSKICSTVLRPAPKLASPCLGGWSALWSCSPRLYEGSLRWWGYSLVMLSTPLTTSSVPRSSDIELIVFSLFLPPHYLSVQLLACFHCLFYFPFSTGGLSSLSVEYQLVCSMEPSVSSELTVVHATAVSCPPPQDSILVCDQLTITHAAKLVVRLDHTLSTVNLQGRAPYTTTGCSCCWRFIGKSIAISPLLWQMTIVNMQTDTTKDSYNA